MKKLLNKITTALAVAVLGFSFALAVPAGVQAQTKDDICKGVGITGGTQGCADPAGAPTVNNVLKTVISFLSFIVGFIAVVMVIIGGFKYITSGGDAGKVTSAKNTLLYAIVGLVVVLLAQVIVRFVLNNVR
jgi:hypothetical protein